MRRVVRVSAFGLATRYGLDGLGIETRWGRVLPHSSILSLGPIHSHVHLVPGPLPGGEEGGVCRVL
jgi:hypothetical protein